MCWYGNPCVDDFKSGNDRMLVGSECVPAVDEKKPVEVDDFGGETGAGGGGGA